MKNFFISKFQVLLINIKISEIEITVGINKDIDSAMFKF